MTSENENPFIVRSYLSRSQVVVAPIHHGDRKRKKVLIRHDECCGAKARCPFGVHHRLSTDIVEPIVGNMLSFAI